MAPSGIFFIPPNPSAAPSNVPIIKLSANLKRQYSLDQLPRWGLEHRLFRETATTAGPGAASGDQSKAFTTQYMQMLSLTQKPGSTHVAITKTHSSAPTGSETSSEPAVIVGLPAPSGEDLFQLVFTRFAPLWAPRSVVTVSNGQAFGVGEFVVRYGELKQGQGSQQQVRGTVVEIEWSGGSDDDWETAEVVIQGFWNDLEVKGAKAFIRVPGVETELPNLRQWFEALRLRA